MQIAFDESPKSTWCRQNWLTSSPCFRPREKDFMSSKDKEIEVLKLRVLEARKALDKVSRPGSSYDMPVNVASATGTVTKVTYY